MEIHEPEHRHHASRPASPSSLYPASPADPGRNGPRQSIATLPRQMRPVAGHSEATHQDTGLMHPAMRDHQRVPRVERDGDHLVVTRQALKLVDRWGSPCGLRHRLAERLHQLRGADGDGAGPLDAHEDQVAVIDVGDGRVTLPDETKDGPTVRGHARGLRTSSDGTAGHAFGRYPGGIWERKITDLPLAVP
jgi:hypothetical protein